ncbi:MAG: phosphoenolpyruvate synthase/pyruvate phosphate dikinase [Desulfobacteraceae bacterium]|nr:phosphoenolpyruvate synthase/pyruvate phosphate dikinase [Desulfobacteraceae bacterium]
MIGNERISKTELHVKPEIFRELMPRQIREILLISSLYNIYNMEEDGSLTSKIMNEYTGLNLSHPPRITGVSSVEGALTLLREKKFDLVFMVPHLEGMDPVILGARIKTIHPDLPVILLSPSTRGIFSELRLNQVEGIDRTFIWSGNPDMLLAMVKNTEDHLNVRHDTRSGNVRVVILVEDSPEYASYFLPIIYKEIVSQTQALLEIGCNDTLKLLTMRARPKILLAATYEEAMDLYEQYRSYLLCVISDNRLSKAGKDEPGAGISILSRIRKEIPEIPLLLMSSEEENRARAEQIPAVFLDKNVSDLYGEIHSFFLNHLGFGDFVFCSANGEEIDRASNLMKLEEKLVTIPDDSLMYHADRDHFSNWLMARSEIGLGLQFRAVKSADFKDADELRNYIITNVHELRIQRYRGIILQFDRNLFDAEVMEFVKIGRGSLGGKARGLAFMAGLLRQHPEIQERYPDINVRIPKTLVICTDIFDRFVSDNDLQGFLKPGFKVGQIVQAFIDAPLPEHVTQKLAVFLEQVTVPLAVRSSSQLEDAHFQPYAGLYKTYKIPNNHPDPLIRLDHLATAIKLVYASTYYEDAKAFYRSTSTQPFNDSMAVIIQEVGGDQYDDYFYPAISGVAQSYNFYPFSHMKAEDGVLHLALGLGKTVVEGEQSFRVSPRYPHITPQFATAGDFLDNTQRSFYALKTKGYPEGLHFPVLSNLERREVADALDEFPVKALASTYVADEDRIRDTWYCPGPKVLTFAQVLKYDTPHITGLINDLLELGREGLGAPVEIEFSANLYAEKDKPCDFFFLQIRPTVTSENRVCVTISREEMDAAVCFSAKALGNGIIDTMADIVYVKPGDFKGNKTREMAREINAVNAGLVNENRRYLLAGPGRWGASDPWLGIPVKWRNISGAGAILETRSKAINADPSQGSHFFHNITSLGIPYITVNETLASAPDRIDWQWLEGLPGVNETTFLRHVRLPKPLMVKIDGKQSWCVILAPDNRTQLSEH